jgi:hypothetical protein
MVAAIALAGQKPMTNRIDRGPLNNEVYNRFGGA